MNARTMVMQAGLAAAAAIFTAASGAQAQESAASVVMGRVSAAYHAEALAARAARGASVQVRREGPSAVVLAVANASSTSEKPEVVELDLALRTNGASYQLMAERVYGQGEPRINATLAGVSGAGAMVAPDAAANFRAAEVTMLKNSSSVIAAGTRISIRGNFASPENALLVRVRLEIPAGSSEALAIRIRMGP